MFISKSEHRYLKESIKYLDKRLNDERNRRYELEAQINVLTKHLGVEIVKKSPEWIVRNKSK